MLTARLIYETIRQTLALSLCHSDKLGFEGKIGTIVVDVLSRPVGPLPGGSFSRFTC